MFFLWIWGFFSIIVKKKRGGGGKYEIIEKSGFLAGKLCREGFGMVHWLEMKSNQIKSNEMRR